MNNTIPKLMLTALCVLGMAACNINTPVPTPTAQSLLTPSPTPDATLSPTATIETPDPVIGTATPIVISTPLPTIDNAPPSLPASPSPTEGPYTYTIKPNDELGIILQLQPWGYPPFDPGVLAAVVALNNLPNADLLPPAGTELLIPRRTPTPIPDGASATATSDASIGLGERLGNITLPQGASADCHIVVEGDSIISLAVQYNTTLETLSQLNQDLNWFGCQFDEYSGGPGCRPSIKVDQCVIVPQPTPTPVPSPTLSGRETATPTPTYAVVRGFYPPDGAVAPPITFNLEWVSVGILGTDDVYLVEVLDLTSGQQFLDVTRNTSFVLPATLVPTDGKPHLMQWRVSVARRDTNGMYNYNGATGAWRNFQWQSR